MDNITLSEIKNAAKRVKPFIVNIPLVKLNISKDEKDPVEIYLKLENLQPICSFKLRGAANALNSKQDAKNAVWTASAGNMGAAVAWIARDLNLGCTVVVPNNAPEAKLNNIKRINPNTKVIKVSRDEWWKIIETHKFDNELAKDLGLFIHPVCNRDVIAGNGTIGLEIFEELPDVDTVIVPYGGGGLSSG
jgi:threonine dehydratase